MTATPLTKGSFNSFYQINPPKFTQEMADVLVECNNRAYRPALAKSIPLFHKAATDKYYADIAEMTRTAEESER